MRHMGKSSYYFTIGNKKYYLDINKIMGMCNTSSNNTENEITQTYERDENGNFDISGKILREIKSNDGEETNTVIYDIIKTFILKIMECDEIYDENNDRELDLPTSLCINTLIHYEILKELE